MNFSINKAAVLGAGVMGAGIAAHLAGAGISVLLLDVVPGDLTAKEKEKGLTLESKEFRNRLAQSGKERVLDSKTKAIYHKDLGALIKVGNLSDDLHLLGEVDWIIEVVVERLDVKQKLFSQVNEVRKPGAIVSSNTSGVSINKIVAGLPLEFRQHFMGTHFFNPPRWMKLLEIIPSEDCLPELVDFMVDFGCKRLGKGIVLAKDTPNFIGNRIGTYAYMQVTKKMQEYGFTINQVDEITGTVMGRPKSATFRTLDMVGLDIFCHVANNVVTAVDDTLEKAEFQVPVPLQKLLEKGYLGDKTGQGFYKKVKTDKGSQTLVWDFATEEYGPQEQGVLPWVEAAKKQGSLAAKLNTLLYGTEKDSLFAWEVTKKTLLYAANKMTEIAHSFEDIDKAMMWGYNWELGPFALWDAIGLAKSVERMRAEGEIIPVWIEKLLASGQKSFYEISGKKATPYIQLNSDKQKVIISNKDAALLDLGDGVACLEFRSKSNTVSDLVVEMIGQALAEVERNYRGLVIGNQSKNFSVGADLTLIGKLASEKKFTELGQIVSNFQKANMAIKYFTKPVVAAPCGMTLGGGAEIAMHAHQKCASAETYMGLVEVGVGLIPGGGGTKEMLLNCTQELSETPENDLSSALRKAWETIATAKVSGSAHDAIRKGYLRKNDRIVMNQDYLIDEAKAAVLCLAESGFRPLQKKPVKVLGTSGRAYLQYVIDFMQKGNFISEYDAYIANLIARVMTGGDVPSGVLMAEEQILELEKEAFVSLSGEAKTLQRIEYMLTKGKPLRN